MRWLMLTCCVAIVGCSEEQAPLGPPRCEPLGELRVERALKQGFRALSARQSDNAQKAFQKALETAPRHPEALQGLREAEQLERHGGQQHTRMVAIVAERPYAIPASVNTERMRYEETVVRRKLRRRQHGADGPPRPVPFTHRRSQDPKTTKTPPTAFVRDTLDLIVLHDTYTSDARTFFVESGEEGTSAHFLIDYEGTIYQTLDLVYAAKHVSNKEIERRSLAVVMVNPVDQDRPPLPDGISEPKRQLSNPVSRHGKSVRQWGYTRPQMRSLRQLVNGLIHLFPKLPAHLPRATDGKILVGLIPESDLPFKGVAGHAHFSKRATDPTVGLDWESLKIR